MTFVVELRDLKKSLPRPVAHFWQQATGALCALRFRLAVLGLLGCALACPLDTGATASSGILALLCGVLTAAASATLGLLCDASSALSGLSEHANAALGLGQRLDLRFTEPLLKFDICPETGPFPALSGHSLVALAACAFLLFGPGLSHREPAK
jgi:hypothetical protein